MIEFLESDATRWDPASLNRLKYRRQFAFGPRPLVLDGAWRTHQVGRDWFFTVHEDLPFYRGQNSGGAILVLLGFLIDADRPHLGDAELVQELTQYSDWDQVLRATANYSGRWAVFHIGPDRVRVVNDAAGLRSVFFLTEGHEPWCFSQPGLYRSIQAASYLDSAVEFIYSRQSQKDLEAWWPGSSSPFAEVEHLLPNHYLDLTARTTARFWPHESLEPLDPETAVNVSAGILQKSFAAMAARGRIALALTSGWDSRTLLAAGRAVANQAWLYTAMYGELREASGDIRIPSAMCDMLGLDYHVLRCPKRMSEPLKTVYLRNNDPAHLWWGRICQGMVATFPNDTVAIRGNLAEIARCFYYKNGVYPGVVSASDLARLARLPSSPFVERHTNTWFAGAQVVVDLGYRLLDFYYWENRMANWLGASHTEHDLIHETFSPFNHRRLLSTLLATPIQVRCKPEWKLYRRLIERLWPELLRFPLNPPATPMNKWRHKLRKAGRQLGTLLGQRADRVRLQAHECSKP